MVDIRDAGERSKYRIEGLIGPKGVFVACFPNFPETLHDSGDAWVRIALGKGEGVVLPPRVWRRVALADAEPFAVVARLAAGGAGDDVVRRLVG